MSDIELVNKQTSVMERGACREQRALFRKVFPGGAPVTMAAARKAIKAGLDVFWIARLLPQPLYDEYDAKCKSLYDEYEAKRKPVDDEYEAKCKLLDYEYWAKCKPLDDEYAAKCKPLDDEYAAKCKPLDDEYAAKRKPLYDEYAAKRKPLYDEYEAKRFAILVLMLRKVGVERRKEA